MDIINITKADLTETNSKLRGYESKLYIYGDNLIKIFFDDSKIENKISKLKLLSEKNTGMIKPLDFVAYEGEIIGYTMPYLKNYYPIDPFLLNRKSKKEVLRKLKNKIDELHQEGIIYGDFNNSNLLINDNLDLELCDFDNVAIGGYDTDLKSSISERYIKKFGLDETYDEYMYNLYCVCLLDNIHQALVLDYIMHEIHHFKRNNKEYLELVKNYVKLQDKNNFKPLRRL